MQTQILIGLFICHFLADFTPLSTPWMLHAKCLGKPLVPILTHACVHGILMLVFMLSIGVRYEVALQMWLLQVVTHFSVDVLKGRMNGWFPTLQDTSSKGHWTVFGFDQLLHAIVIIIMSSYIV